MEQKSGFFFSSDLQSLYESLPYVTWRATSFFSGSKK